MADAVLDIAFAGPLVSVQDSGRAGLMRFGVPASGPLDRLAAAAANLALGNAAGAPLIEVSLGGLSLVCRSGQVGFAVAGGGFVVEHAGHKGGAWACATLRAGERLTIRPGHWGSWCYLALAGKLQVPHWLGAAATHALSGLGGGMLATGHSLTLTGTGSCAPRAIPCPVGARPRHDIRVTLGPQDRFFAPEALARFLGGAWVMTSARDRMGARLSGPDIAPSAALDMPSEPILRGSVQVAGDGVASVLLADHQTTGGYPKIATMLDCDLDGLAQLRPQDRLRFVAVTPDRALQVARSAMAQNRRYLDSLAARAPDLGPPDLGPPGLGAPS